MTWNLFRWTWLLESPLYIGATPAGSLNRCRLYVPARALWAALTAELARRNAVEFPNYEGVGTVLQGAVRFSYLYPAEDHRGFWRAWLPRYEKGKGLVWRREDRADARSGLTDREMRVRLLGTRPGTAIDPSSDSGAEGSLRETECVNPCWRDEAGVLRSRVAFVGYIFIKDTTLNPREIGTIFLGGDTRYGLGRLRREGECELASDVFCHRVQLNADRPAIVSDCILAHGGVSSGRVGPLCGQREALGEWQYGKLGLRHAGPPLWVPGSVADAEQEWTIDATGYWEFLSKGG